MRLTVFEGTIAFAGLDTRWAVPTARRMLLTAHGRLLTIVSLAGVSQTKKWQPRGYGPEPLDSCRRRIVS